MGFNDQEIVALSGAHTLGRCHADRSGFVGPWTNGGCVGVAPWAALAGAERGRAASRPAGGHPLHTAPPCKHPTLAPACRHCHPPTHHPAAPTTFSNLYFVELTENKWHKKK